MLVVLRTADTAPADRASILFISYVKIKEGVIVGPAIRKLIDDDNFTKYLSATDRAGQPPMDEVSAQVSSCVKLYAAQVVASGQSVARGTGFV